MNASSVLIALPVFFLAYQGIGLLLEARANQKWNSPSGTSRRSFPSQKIMQGFTNLSAKLSFNKILLQNKKFNARLELFLLRSGYPFGWKPEDLLFCKELTAAFIFILFCRADVTQPSLLLLGLCFGFLVPDLYLKSKISTRQAAIQRRLPGFIDLLALALESGLDLMTAIERILEKMKTSSLGEELNTLLQENRLGTSRKEALEHLAHRVNLPDIQSLTSIIIQSEELGTSLSSVLRNYAEDMRNRRIFRAEEIAGKAPVKLLFPMMVFFFPIVFIIIFGPLALNFMSSYK